MERPILGITMGDPASIGPEIAAKALAEASVYERARPLVIGDRNVMADALGITKLPLTIHPIATLAEARFTVGMLDLLDLHNVEMAKHAYGKVSPMCGKASVEYIEKAIAMALAKEIDAVVTGATTRSRSTRPAAPTRATRRSLPFSRTPRTTR